VLYQAKVVTCDYRLLLVFYSCMMIYGTMTHQSCDHASREFEPVSARGWALRLWLPESKPLNRQEALLLDHGTRTAHNSVSHHKYTVGIDIPTTGKDDAYHGSSGMKSEHLRP
jgi:hypothetical protein